MSDKDARMDRMEEALHRIASWAQAYPLEAFPAPDKTYWAKAREVLEANGMSLDRISADNMRHVITQVGGIAADGLVLKRADPERWQPIETAPKDETYVLGTNGGLIPFVMAWDVTDECWVTFNQYYERDVFPDDKAFMPTHWMPLPAPPGKP